MFAAEHRGYSERGGGREGRSSAGAIWGLPSPLFPSVLLFDVLFPPTDAAATVKTVLVHSPAASQTSSDTRQSSRTAPQVRLLMVESERGGGLDRVWICPPAGPFAFLTGSNPTFKDRHPSPHNPRRGFSTAPSSISPLSCHGGRNGREYKRAGMWSRQTAMMSGPSPLMAALLRRRFRQHNF